MTESVLEPVLLSLKIATLAAVGVFCLGLGLARIMTLKPVFPGKNLIEGLITLPLVLPPTVIGFGFLIILGKHGPFGQFLEAIFHIKIIFSWWAALIASAITAFPLMYQSAKGALEAVDNNLEKAARTLGAGELRVFLTVTVPLAWPGILAGLILAFTRSLGEFGATLMVAGNIPGRTQTIPLAIYSAVEAGEEKTALVLVCIVTLLAFVFLYILNRCTGLKRGQIGRV